jgi:hypothetical protein
MNLQGALYKYLTKPINLRDYTSDFRKWQSVAGTSGSPSKADLDEFVDWLREKELKTPWNADPKWMFTEAQKKGAREVFIHFTNSLPRKFTQGTTISKMHLAAWKEDKDKARCPANLRLSLEKAVFVFAYPAEYIVGLIEAGTFPEYGRNAVIGRTDQAVEVWHVGDEEYQLVFPVCSEYDLVLVEGALDDGGQPLIDAMETAFP